MADIKILSWNVEHFDGIGGSATRGNDRDRLMRLRRDRVDRVVEHVKDEDPDIFGLSEVEGAIVFSKMTQAMPGYSFHITEGKQSQEILIGVRGGLTNFFTQRQEFKRGNAYLRPGALVTVVPRENVNVPILFAHLKSSPSPEGFGLRDAMFDKAFSLKKKLDEVARGNGNEASNFIMLGDLNLMGMDYERREHDISGEKEMKTVRTRFRRRGMDFLVKDHGATFNNGSDSQYPQSDLDHVIAAKHLDFLDVNDDGDKVHVGGWAELAVPRYQDEWIEEFSDHAPLTMTLQI